MIIPGTKTNNKSLKEEKFEEKRSLVLLSQEKHFQYF